MPSGTKARARQDTRKVVLGAAVRAKSTRLLVFLSRHTVARNQKHKVAQERGLIIEKRKEPTSFRGKATWVSWRGMKPRMSSGLQQSQTARAQRPRGLNSWWQAMDQKTHRKCESSGANRFSGRLEDLSARARSFRLKSEWTESAPGPSGPSRFLFAPPPNLTFVLVSPSGLRFLSPRGLVWREAHTNCRVGMSERTEVFQTQHKVA